MGSPSSVLSEVLGLVLLVVGLLLCFSLYAPTRFVGGMGELIKREYLLQLGWGAFALPLPFLALSPFVFLGRRLRPLLRYFVGAFILLFAAMLGSELLQALSAGRLSHLLGKPLLSTLGMVSLLIPFLLLELGLEVLFKVRPLTLLAGAFGLLVMGLRRVWLAFHRLGSGARDAGQLANTRLELRRTLENHRRDLSALSKLYPQAQELERWEAEALEAQKKIGVASGQDLEHLREDLEQGHKLVGEFATLRAGDLRRDLADENQILPPQLTMMDERLANRLEGKFKATGQLENLRRSLLLDAGKLQNAAGKLEREREACEKRLTKGIPTAHLERELEAHTSRLAEWREVQASAKKWVERSSDFLPWVALIEDLEANPHATDFATDLETALKDDLERALGEFKLWQRTFVLAKSQAVVPVVSVLEPKQEVVEGALELEGESPITFVGSVSVPAEPKVESIFSRLNPLESEDSDDEDDDKESPVQPARIPARAPLTPPWEEPSETLIPSEAKSNPIGGIPVERPGLNLLEPIPNTTLDTRALEKNALERGALITQAFEHFKVQAKVVDFARGPTVTRYEIEPSPGEKIARVSSLSNDLARVLSVSSVRVEGTIPGKNLIGLEVPNAVRDPVGFHATIAAPAFRQSKAKLPIILGKSIDGEIYVADLAKMPHALIAGSTGSGKSVAVNVLISSLLFKYLPQELRFIMVDPKMVELTPYDGIPHLLRPVVTNPADAAGVLLGCVAHMERRYKMMSQIGAKNLEQYNAKVRQLGEPELPFIVIIIDELADLMITSPKEVESAIMRLAQMARATGMHLMLATQRPSVDILTSLIKVNVPARMAFAVSSTHDSRTILDCVGAERLTGMGDMLFFQPGLGKPVRLQAPYISETETGRIADFLRRQFFDDAFGEAYGSDFEGIMESDGPSSKMSNEKMDFSDPLLREAAVISIEEGQGSVSRLQRRLSVGHARAGKLMDLLEAMGIVSKSKGSKPRDILITEADLPEYFGK